MWIMLAGSLLTLQFNRTIAVVLLLVTLAWGLGNSVLAWSGALHVSGGAMLMAFAALAGLLYGLAWMWSGKLWVATLFHFGLNLYHLLFFTYPMLQRGV
ncbi:putative membrane protein [Dickeya dadantii 3937]|uniref:Putative membrane protein n=1 Tax=Dickeya dadantii (strain 3937) TaxID=198628 RepID=E0SIZ2_DICD3|nr:putative membrane protein [Dickeya dadantii 3937]